MFQKRIPSPCQKEKKNICLDKLINHTKQTKPAKSPCITNLKLLLTCAILLLLSYPVPGLPVLSTQIGSKATNAMTFGVQVYEFLVGMMGKTWVRSSCWMRLVFFGCQTNKIQLSEVFLQRMFPPCSLETVCVGSGWGFEDDRPINRSFWASKGASHDRPPILALSFIKQKAPHI